MASDETDGDLSDHLRLAEDHFDQAIEVFQSTLQRIREGEDVSTADVERVSKALFGATNTLLNYKVRLYDQRKRHEGVVNGYSLDLDEARDHVGRLLDRLRATHNPGSVPR